jgi:hypothetical protein
VKRCRLSRSPTRPRCIFNDDDLEFTHLPNAHTETDIVVRFRKANVLHMGDTFTGSFPFIDGGNGGTLDGFIRAHATVLATVDDNTKIIRGHGPLGNKAELQAYHDMLVVVRDRVAKLVKAGKTQEQVLEARPTREFEEKYGGANFNAAQWIGRAYVDQKMAFEQRKRKYCACELIQTPRRKFDCTKSAQHNAPHRGLFAHFRRPRRLAPLDRGRRPGESDRKSHAGTARDRMKDSSNTIKLLDLPYAAEAEQYLDELERSGQFRVGLEAEAEVEAETAAQAQHAEYFWGRGSGNVAITDWWTAGRLDLRVGPGIAPASVTLSRLNDSLLVRTQDGLDRMTIDNYLGLIPDASTLRILFNDGSEWAGAAVFKRISSWVVELDSTTSMPNN